MQKVKGKHLKSKQMKVLHELALACRLFLLLTFKQA